MIFFTIKNVFPYFWRPVMLRVFLFLGFKIIERNAQNVLLSPDGKMPYLIALSKSKSNDPNQQKRAGLYHFAILLPQGKFSFKSAKT